MEKFRIFSDGEVEAIFNTVIQLRKMRTAALATALPFRVGASNLVSRLFTGPVVVKKSPHAVLAEGERLADSAAKFLAGKLSKTVKGQKSIRNFDAWREALGSTEGFYRHYPMSTHAQTSLAETVGRSIIGRTRNLHIDPDYQLKWDLLQNNNLGGRTLGEITEGEVGIISPFSGDYLMAKIYSNFLRMTTGKGFPARAAIVSRDLTQVVLPLDVEDKGVFENRSAVAMYIDTTETGGTGRALHEAIQDAYPGKMIYPPPTEVTEFVQSLKMEFFWERLARFQARQNQG
jgi:hypothetical protein